MDKESTTYSIEQVKQEMEKYLDASQERLRIHLRAAWKKQSSKIKTYERYKI